MNVHLDLMSEMSLLTCIFMVVSSDASVLNSPRYYIIFPPAVSLVL